MKYYSIVYASTFLVGERANSPRIITSSVDLNKDDFVIIEKKDSGVFIGRVVEEVTPPKSSTGLAEIHIYNYLQHIDLSDYLKKLENAKRKEELKVQMEKRFAEIDKEKKYQYYAELDADFKAMFEEYKGL